MVLQKVGSTLTEILVNGTSEYGPSEQSDDSAYDVSISTSASLANDQTLGTGTGSGKSLSLEVWETLEDFGSLSGNLSRVYYDVWFDTYNCSNCSAVEVHAMGSDLGSFWTSDTPVSMTGHVSNVSNLTFEAYNHDNSEYQDIDWDITYTFDPILDSSYTVDSVTQS